MITRKDIQRVLRLFDLHGWDIKVTHETTSESGDCLGDCMVLPEYRTADIRLYDNDIADSRVSEYDVFIHEIGEVVAAECLFCLPEKMRDTKEYDKAADYLAEKLLRIHKCHMKNQKK